jgi:hypothetical protein
MADIDTQIVAFTAMLGELEAKYLGKWVLFHEGNFIAAFDTYESAAQDALAKFGRGPYLIRQVGASRPTLPASVLYQPIRHAAG